MEEEAVTAHELSSGELIELMTDHQVAEPESLWQYLADRGGAGSLPPGGAAAAAELVAAGLLTPFQADRLLTGDGLSLGVGRYRLLDRLGGRVYLGERRPGGLSKVAIKVLPLTGQHDRADVERFRREAEALARLDHPGIVSVKEVGEDGGRLFLIMPLVEGRTFRQVVADEGPLLPAPAARLIGEAALTLSYVHESGLIHRDVQPDHLMRDGRGAARLLGLGLVRFLDSPADNLTHNLQPDAVLGEVAFLSPEQILDSHEADARSDVYGLGATFYFLLTGQAPFSRHAALRLASGVVAHPQPLAQLRPDVPQELREVVERMMAMSAEARYQTAAEAAAAIGRWLAEVYPPPLIEPRRSTARLEAATRPEVEKTPEPAPAAASEGASLWLTLALMGGVAALVLLGALALRWLGV
jgi:serine/threonine-protein kinase